MRRAVLLSVLLVGCASGGGGSAGPPVTATGDRVVLVDERGQVYRSPAPSVAVEQQVVPGTMRQSVEALVGAYESLGLGVNTVDWTQGVVAARGVVAPRRIAGAVLSRYVDCGSTHVAQRRADSYAITLTVESVVRPGETDKMVISTLTSANARPRGVSGDAIPCTTTNALERRIHLQVAERLAGG